MGKEVCIVNSECFKTEYPVGSTISIEGVNCKVVEDIGLYCNDCILGCKREGITCRNPLKIIKKLCIYMFTNHINCDIIISRQRKATK